jgi:hypothetical protein
MRANDSNGVTVLSRNFLRSFGPIADIRCWRPAKAKRPLRASGENQTRKPERNVSPCETKT